MEMVATIMVYKFTQLTRAEVDAMLKVTGNPRLSRSQS